MNDIKNLIILGNLVRDPEVKTVGNTTVTEFTIAVNGKDKDVMYVRCSAWGAQGEPIAKYMKKGSKMLVSGELKISTYVSKEGKPGFNVEISKLYYYNFLPSGTRTEGAAPAAPQYNAKVEEPVPVDEEVMPF